MQVTSLGQSEGNLLLLLHRTQEKGRLDQGCGESPLWKSLHCTVHGKKQRAWLTWRMEVTMWAPSLSYNRNDSSPSMQSLGDLLSYASLKSKSYWKGPLALI